MLLIHYVIVTPTYNILNITTTLIITILQEWQSSQPQSVRQKTAGRFSPLNLRFPMENAEIAPFSRAFY